MIWWNSIKTFILFGGNLGHVCGQKFNGRFDIKLGRIVTVLTLFVGVKKQAFFTQNKQVTDGDIRRMAQKIRREVGLVLWRTFH